jgi:hypothetical protein
MSQQLVSRNDDLRQLRDEGYEVSTENGYLLVGHVPFRDAAGHVAYGTLVSTLNVIGDVTQPPDDHRMWVVGGIPHTTTGAALGGAQALGVSDTITTDCVLSRKCIDNGQMRSYRDYYEKVTTYIALLSEAALAIEPTVTAVTHPVIPADEDDQSVFNYIDTASSRAGIAVITDKLKIKRVAIVGLGGSGSYILDFLAKTPVEEIHLFDGDEFLQHNAFRSPGAPSISDLERKLSKVEHFAQLYAPMRRGIIAHEQFIDETNVNELQEMNFVFVAADSSTVKALLAAKLVEFGVPFIDVGMGLRLYDDGASIGGQLRTTTATAGKHDHLAERISFADEPDGDDIYSMNIQVAELNAMNAALAVLKWKKLVGFYFDDENEHHSTYVVSGNVMVNDERAG